MKKREVSIQPSSAQFEGLVTNRMPGLDGIRALAVCAVVWHHTHGGIKYLPMTTNGFLGVDVFFVLSGFLITTLLIRERAKIGKISLKNFYVRRSLRIFPLYYLILFILAVYFIVIGGSSSQRALFNAELPFHLTYTSNWVEAHSIMAITWSLSTEEQFYLCWPLLLVLFKRFSALLLSVFLILNQAVNFGWLDATLSRLGIAYESLAILQCTFTPIILGSLLAFALASAGPRRFLERITQGQLIVLFGALMLVAANVPGDIRGWPRLTFHVATAAFLAAVVLRPSHRVVQTLEWKPMAFVGTISYGIYLLHMLVVDLAKRGLGKAGIGVDDWLFVVTMVGTIALASLSYRYFELPILRLKDRFR
jgi:peptidoglycan/LPS O-acetylase OafA/YrhL